MSKYKSYEVTAIKAEWPSSDWVVACDDDDPERVAFGLYGRDEMGCARWISDHETREEAEMAMLNEQNK